MPVVSVFHHYFVVFAMLVLLVSGCTVVGDQHPFRDPSCDADGEALMAACRACHSASLVGADRFGASLGVDFDTDADMRRHEARIRVRAITEGSMPPGTPLDACERQALGAWLDTLGDAPCAAECSDRVCGDDGCGGSCGQCAAGESCSNAGLCIADACTPVCTGVACGDDGCGGSCGTCSDGFDCDASGACVCVPACDGRLCGPDGCGGAAAIATRARSATPKASAAASAPAATASAETMVAAGPAARAR